jgi:hypothetical protein
MYSVYLCIHIHVCIYICMYVFRWSMDNFHKDFGVHDILIFLNIVYRYLYVCMHEYIFIHMYAYPYIYDIYRYLYR